MGTLRLRVGERGRIVLPKQIREALGIDEGDEVIAEVSDVIVIRPAKRSVDADKLREILRAHAEELAGIPTRKEPRPGDLAKTSIEEEFE
ncbi:looped-hinge helix DNA binding domain, AbrB family [Pyrobaculum oguniense TE7]|uniref:Looped-hinge helix DNA binding domain, AbrB family n=1 Tax=Pyrobaculum oguniense (strain DSM 13380 / JCM 10595 / TE7) TaxID=698757 RepID=H6QBA0_PYROT|nr:looped-hinge helix DNA binding domain, AbrB family [Pyrobaculum oguniense TE7]